jgi:hypothetical protein
MAEWSDYVEDCYLFFSFLACMPRNSCINQANEVWRGGLRLDSCAALLGAHGSSVNHGAAGTGTGHAPPGNNPAGNVKTPRGWRGPRKDRGVRQRP